MTGLQANVANEGDSGSSSSAKTSGSTPATQSPDTPTPIIIETASVVTAGGPTVFVTAPGQTTPSSDPATESSTAPKPSPKPNTAGIAAGVVVGVVVLGAMLGGGYLYLRSRKRRAVEEEYRRNAAISSAAGGDKPPGSAGSISDSRLEPSVMLQRRQSDGSIADNQDYSRRILKVLLQSFLINLGYRLTSLKVTNPDGT